MNKKFWYSLILALLATLVALPDSALASGKPLGRPFLVTSALEAHYERRPAVAYNSQYDEYLVVYYNEPPDLLTTNDIRAERIKRDGTHLGSIEVAAGSGRLFNPDVAYNPHLNEYMVVWEENPNYFVTEIVGQRLAYDASKKLMKQGSEIQISSTCGIYCHNTNPAVAYADNIYQKEYLVVWGTYHATENIDWISARFLMNDGYPKSSIYTLAKGNWDDSLRNPDLAYNLSGNRFLVVWEKLNYASSSTPVEHSDIYGMIVYANGPTMSSQIPIMSSSLHNEANPSVAAIPGVSVTNVDTKGQFMVAAEFYSSSSSRDFSDIATILVNSDGSLSSYASRGLVMPYIINGNPFGADINPAVAGSKGLNQFLVTWSATLRNTLDGDDEDLWISDPHIWGQTFEAGTGAPSGNPQVLCADFSLYPAVASGKSGDFLVVTTFEPAWEIIGMLWGVP